MVLVIGLAQEQILPERKVLKGPKGHREFKAPRVVDSLLFMDHSITFGLF